jgi:hypothetical protein
MNRIGHAAQCKLHVGKHEVGRQPGAVRRCLRVADQVETAGERNSCRQCGHLARCVAGGKHVIADDISDVANDAAGDFRVGHGQIPTETAAGGRSTGVVVKGVADNRHRERRLG